MIKQVLNQIHEGDRDNDRIVKSILRVDADDQHELFVLFSPGTTNGPAISRTGRGSPTMVNPVEPFAEPTADPDLQRCHCCVVDHDLRLKEIVKISDKIKHMPSPTLKVCLQTHLDDLQGQQTYSDLFTHLYGSGTPSRPCKGSGI